MNHIIFKKSSINKAISTAREALSAGKLVIYPTETSYGIAADATNPAAIQALRQYKGNRQNKPFSIIVSSRAMAEEYVSLTPLAAQLYEDSLPGAVTVISTGIPGTVAPGVMSENGSIGIRIPKQDVVLDMVALFGKPVTATSANPSDEKQPYDIAELLKSLTAQQKELVAVIIDAGTLSETLPTTIVDARGQQLKVLRQGEIFFDTSNSFSSDSPKQTIEQGSEIIRTYKSFWGKYPIILALSGEMGAGKTHFTKGIAHGLGIETLIKSPSYALVHEYTFIAQKRQLPFLHVDAWRLERSADINALGIEEALQQNGIVALEWATHGQALIDEWNSTAVILQVTLRAAEDESKRHFTIQASFPENLA